MNKIPIYNNDQPFSQKFKQTYYNIKYNPQKIDFIDNKLILYGNAINYIDIDNGISQDKVQKQKFPVTSASWRKDKQLVVSGDDRGVLQVSMVSSRSVIRRLYGSKTQISCCQFSNDGLKVYVGNVSGQVFIFNISLGNAIFAVKLSNDTISSIAEIQHNYLLISTTSGQLFLVSTEKQVIQKGVSEEKPINDNYNPAILKLTMENQINKIITLSETELDSYVLIQFQQYFKIIKITQNQNTQENKFTIIDQYKSYEFSKEITNICRISSQQSKKMTHIQYLSQDNYISQNYLQNNHLLITSIDGTIRDEQSRIIYSQKEPILQIGYYQDQIFYLSNQQQLVILQRTTDQLLQRIQQIQNQESLLHGHTFTIVKVPLSIKKQNSTASQYLFKSNYLKALEVSLHDTQAASEAILRELDKLHGSALQNAILGCQGEILKILLQRLKIMLSNEQYIIAIKILKILVDQKQDIQILPEYEEIKQVIEEYNNSIKYIKLFQ